MERTEYEARYFISSLKDASKAGMVFEFINTFLERIKLGDDIIEALNRSNREWDL